MRVSVCVAAMLVLCSLRGGEARVCYNCTGDCVRDLECKGSCTTSVPELGGDEIRSCIEDTVEARCISKEIETVFYKMCFCNTERCNLAPATTPPTLMMLPGLLLPLLVLLKLR